MTIIFCFDSPGTAPAAGIFIPRDNIPGLIADSELADSVQTIIKDCKFLAGFLATLESTIAANRSITDSLITALGFTVTKGNPIGVEPGVFNQQFIASVAQVIDYSSSTFYPIPVPTSGSNSGRGVLKITDVFPDAVSVVSAGAIAEAGVLIPHTEINAYGAVTATNPSNDTQSRQWFAAMLRYFFNEIPVRANTTNTENFSALITKTLETVSPFNLLNDALSSTNPSTGLDPTKVLVNDVYLRSLSFTIQYLLNEEFRHFEVRTSFNQIFTPVNITRPRVLDFLDVPVSSINPVESINIRFSEIINLSSFNFNDISLTRDNGSNLINSGVAVDFISGTTYQIKGLGSLTLIPGAYQLSINTSGIQNLEGNTGNTTAQTSFSINSIIDFVDNLPPVTTTALGYEVSYNQWLRSSFTTGNKSGGYTLSSVALRFREEIANSNVFIKLYEDVNGGLGNQIAEFVKPIFIPNTTSNYSFTLLTLQMLAANTTYWLVAGISNGSGRYRWAFTNSDNQSGALDWAISDNSLFTGNQGLNWQPLAGSFQFKVIGT